MKKYKYWIASSLVLLAMTLLPTRAMGDECKIVVSGYCLPEIAKGTIEILRSAQNDIQIKLPEEQKDVLIAGNDYLKFYNSLWDKMIEKKLATAEDKQKAFEVATKSGGEKIGGINLVVLAAQPLEHLVNKEIISNVEAQTILDGAKKGK